MKREAFVISGSTRGYAAVIGAALLWASCGTVGKALFHGGMSPFQLVQIRVTFSTVFMALAFLLVDRSLFRIRRGDLLYFFLLGGVVLVLVQFSYFMAISKIQVAAAILLEYLAPVLVAVYSMAFWQERVTVPKVTALVLAMAGCYLVVGAYNLQILQMNREGILWGLLAALSFGSYTLLGERGMHRYRPWTVVFYAFLFAGLTLNVLHEPFQYFRAAYTPRQWLVLLYVVMAGTILPFGLYFMGVNYIRSTRTMITATLEPISAAFMAFFLLGEVLEPLQAMGGILVVAAIVLLQLGRERDELAPDRVRQHRPASP
ncbi:MAG TPA: EamA family transporter [Syntrophales bacterium]|nr:EamA family transporter [Syntrophales bacterium]